MKASLVFTVLNEDDRPFSRNVTEWNNLTREQVNELEGRGVAFLKSLNDWGSEVAKEKVK